MSLTSIASPSSPPGAIRLVLIESAADAWMPSMKQLIREFRSFLGELGVDISYQEVEEELQQRQTATALHCLLSLLSLCAQRLTVCLLLCAAVPGKYSRSAGGVMLLAVDDSQQQEGRGRAAAAGCVALRELEPGVAEVKRMYVQPEYRRHGVALLLLQRLIGVAAALGYSRLRLDTLVRLTAANALYARLGFYPIPAYCYNPIADALFFELDLTLVKPGDGDEKEQQQQQSTAELTTAI